ncbi:MAG: alkaline phosphatase family protein, partial [Calditrichaeota bacterium]
EWWSRKLKKRINCVDDSEVQILNGGHNDKTYKIGKSPRNLMVSTVGDELRLATGFGSKVFGVSYKDRAAMLPAGKLANAAYWFDTKTGGFISSTYYMKKLPEWVEKFNQQKFPDRYFGKKWEKLLPDSAYKLSRKDNFPYEMNFKGIGITFPHIITGNSRHPDEEFYKAFTHVPFADKHLLEFAKSLIKNENLGTDSFTDILTISFSATDRIGHLFGPYSVEMQDQIARLDRILAGFFKFLDKTIGTNQYLIILTADHGDAPIPEYMRTLNFTAGRIDVEAVPRGEDSRIIHTTVEAYLDSTIAVGDWVEAFVKPNLYLNYYTIKNHNIKRQKVEQLAKKALLKIPGISSVFTRTELLNGQFSPNSIGKRILNQFYPERSGDLVVHYKPYFITAGYKHSASKGADHETGYDYDTHIPLIFWGPGVKVGNYHQSVILNDLAPTLSSILKIAFPSGNQGHVLYEALLN